MTLKINHRFSLFTFFLVASIFAQGLSQSNQQSFCGVYIKPKQAPLDSTAFVDGFGNRYTKGELDVPENSTGDCSQSGFFFVDFDNNFTNPEIVTICSVFHYLSTVIDNPNNAVIRVQILKMPMTNQDGTPNTQTIATGAANYVFPDCGLTQNTIWKKLYAGYTSNSFDGIIRVNSNFTNLHTLDQDPLLPGSPNLDLYTVILHEVLHCVGFSSNFAVSDANPDPNVEELVPSDVFGNLSGGIYTAWDSYIFGDPSGRYLLKSEPDGIRCCDQWEYNLADFPNFPDDISGSCFGNPGATNLFFHETMVAPVGSNIYGTIGTTLNNYLSHLDEECVGYTTNDY